MSVPFDLIRPGVVFRFKAGLRRVTRLRPYSDRFMVDWEYADGQPRQRRGGSVWGPNFRREAIEMVPDPSMHHESRQLLPSRRTVACLEHPVEIKLTTRCPAKWAMVDMETGELWGHDGQHFQRMTAMQADEVADIARMAAKDT